jgi:hypothetical protein
MLNTYIYNQCAALYTHVHKRNARHQLRQYEFSAMRSHLHKCWNKYVQGDYRSKLEVYFSHPPCRRPGSPVTTNLIPNTVRSN